MAPTVPTPDLDRLTASQAIADVRAGRCTAQALMAACLARIDRHNPALNALIALRRDAALMQAAQIDDLLRRGQATGPLLGLPMSIKDSFATADLPTTASFAPLRHYRPPADATVVARLRAAGAIVLGKSHLPELAGAPHGWSRLFGLTRNPWDLECTPGGSSSGAAVAVATGMSLLDIGSDIGGSIRIPAAYCGIAGLKATENRIPRTGHIPHLPTALGGRGRSVWHLLSFGLLGRCVADLHLAYAVMAGPDGADTTVPPFTPPQPLDVARAAFDRPLRIALWDDFAGLPLCPRTRRALSRFAQRLANAGHQVTRTGPADFDVRAAWQAYGHIAGAEIGLGLPRWQRAAFRSMAWLLPAEQPIARAMAQGMALDFGRYNGALNTRETLIAALDRFLAPWDVVLCPVAPTAPYRGQPMPAHKPPPHIAVGEQSLPYFEATVSMAIPFSLTGHPVVVLPLGPEDGLPVGIQVLGKRWGEEALLGASACLERIAGGFTAPPLQS